MKTDILYAKFPTALEGIKQHALLIEEEENSYGMVSCPRGNYFFKVPKSGMQHFNAIIKEKDYQRFQIEGMPLREKYPELFGSFEDDEKRIVSKEQSKSLMDFLGIQIE